MTFRLMFRAAALAAAALAANTLDAAPAFAAEAPAFAPTRFSVVVEGTGPDVILIPGLSSPRDVWDGARESLGGKYRLHLVQLNGFGGTPAGANADGKILEGSVAELQAYIAANHLNRPAVVGHSMGGLMALMLAKAAPDRVGKLMIVDSLPFIGTLFDPNATVEAIAPQAAAMRNMMLAAPAGLEARKPGAEAIAGGLAKTPDARAKVAQWVLSSDPKVSAEAMYEDMVTDLRPALSGIAAPITLVYPSDASVSGVSPKALYESAYAAAPKVSFAPVADSRHFVMLDQPASFNALLETFLAGGK